MVFDPANFIQCGVNTLEAWEKLHQYVDYMHIKDAIYKDQMIVPAGEGEGRIGDVIDVINGHTDGTVYLTLEPHLHTFNAYKLIDDHELKGKHVFKNGREAFDFAVGALEALLVKHGYGKDENGTWKK